MMGMFLIESITSAMRQWVQKEGPMVLWRVQCNWWVKSRHWQEQVQATCTYVEKLWSWHQENGQQLHLDVGPNWVEGRDIHRTTDVPLQGIRNFAWSDLQELHPIYERQMEDGENIEWTDLIDWASEKYKSLHEAETWKNKDSSK